MSPVVPDGGDGEAVVVAAEVSAGHDGEAELTLSVRFENGVVAPVVLDAEDNGPGLAPADLTHVFERFWRASERPGGCGLGLAIVAAIAQRHGGQATALPAQPRGLCIRLTLPLTATGT